MKYMGSKARIAKQILPIILKDRKFGQWYVEPLAGGMNTIAHVHGKRLANDNHYYLIEMWKGLLRGESPKKITRLQYTDIRDNKYEYPPSLVGWVGFNCSYKGKWFGGFAGETKTKLGTIRDYQGEAIRNVSRQADTMRGVSFMCCSYHHLELPTKSIVYCDPPYEGTTGYNYEFDYKSHWEWVRKISKEGHQVFISEYNAPPDFRCIWQQEVKSSLSANGKVGGNKNSIERLFVYDG